MIDRSLVLLAACFLAGCAAPAESDRAFMTAEKSVLAVAEPAGVIPSGARLSSRGFLDLQEVPPSPFPAEPPPEPAPVDDFARRTSSPDPAVRARAWEEANGSAAFQAELQRLQRVLRREQPDIFVGLRIVREPAVAAEVFFKRDAARSLSRYTSNPLFRPRQGGLNAAEVEKLQALWVKRAQEGRLLNSVGVDPLSGRVELGVAVEEAEFRRRSADLGWVLGPEVKLTFPPSRPAAFAEPALGARIRFFARETGEKGIQLTAALFGRIVLEDGCFRLAREGAGTGPLVIFGRNTQLARDAAGYLVVRARGDGRFARIGERAVWGGPNHVDESDPVLAQLRQACGDGPVTNVAEPQSERLFGVPDPVWVADYARARKLSFGAAWRRVIACLEREEGGGWRGIEGRDRCIRQFN
jgi:hypothetical protein